LFGLETITPYSPTGSEDISISYELLPYFDAWNVKLLNLLLELPNTSAVAIVRNDGLQTEIHGKFNIEVQSVDRYNLNNLYLKTPRGQGASSPHKRS
jgi:hypothetical protein